MLRTRLQDCLRDWTDSNSHSCLADSRLSINSSQIKKKIQVTPSVSLVAKKEWIILGCPDLGLKIVGKEKEQEDMGNVPTRQPHRTTRSCLMPGDPGQPQEGPFFLLLPTSAIKLFASVCKCLTHPGKGMDKHSRCNYAIFVVRMGWMFLLSAVTANYKLADIVLRWL